MLIFLCDALHFTLCATPFFEFVYQLALVEERMLNFTISLSSFLFYIFLIKL